MGIRPFRKPKKVKISVRLGLTPLVESVPIITPKRKKKVFYPAFDLTEVYQYLRYDKDTGGTSG